MGKTMRKGRDGRRVRENTRRISREDRTEATPGVPPGVRLDVTEALDPLDVAKDFSLFLEARDA